MELKDKDIEIIKHCIGMYGKYKPYHRHGKAFYRPWRNYFATGNVADPLWFKLVEFGYAANADKFFWLTAVGIEWFGKIIGVKIWEENQ